MNALRWIVFLIIFTACHITLAQSEHSIECRVSGEHYDELFGYHSVAVDTSNVLLFTASNPDLSMKDCSYRIELNFKKEQSTRGFKVDDNHLLAMPEMEAAVSIDLKSLLLLKVNEIEQSIGYVPTNAQKTKDGAFFIVEKISFNFQCPEGEKEVFRFSSGIAEN